MTNLNDSLPELMRRATENLEPESTDLVERGMQRGLKLRRRRTTLLSFTGVTAVVATAGIIVGGTQLMGSAKTPTEAPAAGTSTTSAPTVPEAGAQPVTPADTLRTLRRLLPPGLQVSDPRSSHHDGGHSASVVLNDGRGASLLTVFIATTEVPNKSCAGMHGTCSVQPDGSVVASYANESLFPYGPPSQNPGGIKQTVLDVSRPDGTLMALYNFNAPKVEGVQHTRANPLLSVADLTRISTSNLWAYPPRYVRSDKPNTEDPGAGKPTVSLAQTQATLKKVLPGTLQFSRPQAWGGDRGGFNAAAYVVNDGKGAFRVEAHLSMGKSAPKCASERAEQHCRVLPNGSVLGWTKEAPSYADERNSVNGVFGNIVTLVHKDGRTITVTSYNATSEKDSRHTRTKPGLTVDQLTTIAADSRWKFPGTGTN